MAENTQLAKIVAPSLNDTSYSAWSDVFDKINKNFENIATMPFIQGVQGDSYTLVEKPIWDADKHLTADGVVLLNSILAPLIEGTTITLSTETTFAGLKTDLSDFNVGEANVLDSFIDKNENLVNNTLYFYVVVDDAGDEVEKQLGQYFYFLDGRIKSVGDAFYKGDASLIGFNDLSGLYRYIPETTLNAGDDYYELTSMMPAIYYDPNKQDICWRFKGVDTGISALGIAGKDGSDAIMNFVKVHVDNINGTNTAEIVAVFNKDGGGEQNVEWNTDPEAIKRISDGYTLICIESETILQTGGTGETGTTGETGGTGTINQVCYIAYGTVYTAGVTGVGDETVYKKFALWSADTIVDYLSAEEKINNYFFSIGRNLSLSPAHYGIEIPADGNRGDDEDTRYTAHVIKTQFKDPDEPPDKSNLIFRLTKNTLQGATGKPQRYETGETGPVYAVFDNYKIRVQTCEIDEASSNDILAGGDYTEIGKGDVYVSKNNMISHIGADGSRLQGPVEAEDLYVFGDNGISIGKIDINPLKITSKTSESETKANISFGGTGNYHNEIYVNSELYVRDPISNTSYTGVGLPIGSVIMWFGEIESENDSDLCFPKNTQLKKYWVVCNGESVAEYPRFYALLQIIGGEKLPDFRGKFPLGAAGDTVSGSIGVYYETGSTTAASWTYAKGHTGGQDKSIFTPMEIQHTHSRRKNSYMEYYGGENPMFNGDVVFETEPDQGSTAMEPIYHNTTPPFLAVHFLIKYR